MTSNKSFQEIGPRYGNQLRPRPKTGGAVGRRPLPRQEPKRPLLKEPRAVPGPKPQPAPAEPADECRELDPLTSRVLEDELQQIMIKVWQTLPDDPPCSVEKQVVDKFRNETGDLLRDILGLNVTKRLLNTFNPLNVKVHFTTKPDRKYLRLFLKKYNFVAFKRIARVVNTFAAQVKTIRDYDLLCRHKDIHCGAAKITITPFYRYKQCPKNLRTVYSTLDEDMDTENKKVLDTVMAEFDDVNVTTSNETTSDPATKEKQDNVSQEKTVTTAAKLVASNTTDDEKTANTSEKTETKIEANKTEEATIPHPNKTPEPRGQNKPKDVDSKPTNVTTKPLAENKTTTTTVKAQPITASSPQVGNQTVAAKSTPKVAPAQPQSNKTEPQPKVAPAKPNTDNKSEVPEPQGKIEPPKPQGKVEPLKPQTKVEPPKPQSKVEPLKPQGKVEPPKPQGKVEPLKPQGKVEPLKPQGKVEPPIPQHKVKPPKSQCKVDPPKPQGKVEPPKSQCKVDPPKPQGKVEPPKSQCKVDPPKPQGKVEPPKPQSKVGPLKSKAIESKKPEPAKPKVMPAKTVAAKTNTVVKTVGNKKAALVNNTKKVANKPAPIKNTKKSFEEKDDFEELNDEDILALMSGGIVLDECSGSDDE